MVFALIASAQRWFSVLEELFVHEVYVGTAVLGWVAVIRQRGCFVHRGSPQFFMAEAETVEHKELRI